MATIVNATATSNVFVTAGNPKTDTIPAVTPGNSVIACFPYDDAGTLTEVSLGGVAGTLVDSLYQGTTTTRNVWYRWDNVTGSPTLVVRRLSINYNYAPGVILECLPLGAASVGASAFGGTGTTINPSVTTTDTDSLITGAVLGVNEVVTPPVGYSKNPPAGSAYEFQVWNPTPGPAGVYTPNLETVAANSWGAKLIAFANFAAPVNSVAWITA